MSRAPLAAAVCVAVGLTVVWLASTGVGPGEQRRDPPASSLEAPRREDVADERPLAPGSHAAEPIDISKAEGSASSFGACGLLRLQARTPEGRGVFAVFAEVGAKRQLFGGNDLPTPDADKPGEDELRGDRRCRRRLKGLGLADFPDVLPGVPVTARFLDRAGREMGRVEVAPLAGGETRVVDVPLVLTPRTLQAHVVDLQGRDVELAVVELGPSGSVPAFTDSASTDRDGCANLGFVAPGVAAVRIALFGSTALMQPAMRLPEEGRLELHMDRGRTVRVHCVDQKGRPVAADSVSAAQSGRSADQSIEFAPLRSGVSGVSGSDWYAEAVPAGTFLFRALIDAGPVFLWAASDDIQLIVPPRVAVDVSWDETVPA